MMILGLEQNRHHRTKQAGTPQTPYLRWNMDSRFMSYCSTGCISFECEHTCTTHIHMRTHMHTLCTLILSMYNPPTPHMCMHTHKGKDRTLSARQPRERVHGTTHGCHVARA